MTLSASYIFLLLAGRADVRQRISGASLLREQLCLFPSTPQGNGVAASGLVTRHNFYLDRECGGEVANASSRDGKRTCQIEQKEMKMVWRCPTSLSRPGLKTAPFASDDFSCPVHWL